MSAAKLPTSTHVCLVVIMCIISIAHIAVGAVYRNDCPMLPFMGVYLMVMGVTVLLYLLLDMACRACPEIVRDIWSGLSVLFVICLPVLFVSGSVWIYSIYEPNYDKTSGTPYCDKTLYLFAFWSTNLTYILLGLLILFGCFACCLCCVQLFSESSCIC